TTFTEGSSPVSIVDSIKLFATDPEFPSPNAGANFPSATVTIASGLDAGNDFLDANVNGTTISKSYSPLTGTLTLTSTSSADTLATFQKVLRTVTYGNYLDGNALGANFYNPQSTTPRTILFTLNDGQDTSSPVTSTV